MLIKAQSLLDFMNEHKALAFIKNESNRIGYLPKSFNIRVDNKLVYLTRR